MPAPNQPPPFPPQFSEDKSLADPEPNSGKICFSMGPKWGNKKKNRKNNANSK